MDNTKLLNLYPNGKIPNGYGYGIREKYNFAELTKKDLYDIATKIAESYNLDENGIRNRL